MRYALHADDHLDGQLFEVGVFTQRLLDLAGPRRDDDATKCCTSFREQAWRGSVATTHELRPGVAVFVPAGTEWSAEGDTRALSVLVHDPEPRSRPGRRRLRGGREGDATAGRQFVLAATPRSAATRRRSSSA